MEYTDRDLAIIRVVMKILASILTKEVACIWCHGNQTKLVSIGEPSLCWNPGEVRVTAAYKCLNCGKETTRTHEGT